MVEYARIVLLVVLVVASSGCGSMPTDSNSTSTPVPSKAATEPSSTADGTVEKPNALAEQSNVTDTAVTVENGTLPVNASLVFQRVLALTNASPPDRVTVTVREDLDWMMPSDGPDPFAQRLGIEPGNESALGLLGMAHSDQVYVSPGIRSQRQLERTLAHEFAHVLFRTETARLLGNDSVPDDVSGSITEGAATHVEAIYARQYLDGGVPVLEDEARRYRNDSAYLKLFHGQYYFGGQYFALRNVPANETDDILRNSPRTMEAIIHGYPPNQDPPEPIPVRTDLDDSVWERAPTWQPDRRGQTRGEFFLRVHLSQFLPEERAADAAAGWGNDTLLTFYDDVPTTAANGSAYAWVVRWDSERDADEFVSAVEPHYRTLDRPNTSMTVTRVGPRTTAVLIGPERFTRAVRMDTENRTVVVTTG